jgi:hypothetical protein
MTSAETAKRLDLLIRNQTASMGLHLYPVRCGCPEHPLDPNLPDEDTTHQPDEPCPFDNFPFDSADDRPSCCSLSGQIAARELQALGEMELSDRMYKDMTAEEASSFSDELWDTAKRIEKEARRKLRKPKDESWNGSRKVPVKNWVYRDERAFEEAIDSLLQAASWYEELGDRGYGVGAGA